MGWFLSASVLSKVAFFLVVVTASYVVGRHDGTSMDSDDMGVFEGLLAVWALFIMVCILKALTQ